MAGRAPLQDRSRSSCAPWPMDMGTQGSGRKRLPNRERLTAEDDALNQIAREVSEARPQLSASPAVPSRPQRSPAAALWTGPQERWAPAFIRGLRTSWRPPQPVALLPSVPAHGR